MVIQDQTNDFKKSLTSFRTIVNWCDNTDMNLFECCIYNRRATPGNWWTKRFSVDHEYIPIFLKGKKPRYFNKKHMMIRNKSHGKSKKSSSRATDGTLIPMTLVENDKMCCGTVMKYNTSARESKAMKDWYIKKKHPASFPNKLARDFITCFCSGSGIVLDPMCGSGTTCVEAEKSNRRWIGIEISEEYCDIVIERLQQKVNLSPDNKNKRVLAGFGLTKTKNRLTAKRRIK